MSLSTREVRVTDYSYSQFDCDPLRSAEGKGTSAGTYILAHQGPTFLLTGQLHVPTEHGMKALVNAYDASGRAANGTYVDEEFKLALSEADVPYTLLDAGVLAALRASEHTSGGSDGAYAGGSIQCEQDLAHALIHMKQALSDPLGNSTSIYVLNAIHIGSGTTGNTMAIFLEQLGSQRVIVRFEDTHKREDFDGDPLGMVVAEFTTQSPTSALEIVAQWIARSHMPKAKCEFPIEIIGASVSWSQRLNLLISKCEVLQKMVAFRPVIKKATMKPGDFLIDSFDGHPLLQCCSTGMKLYPLQENLLQTYQEYGGAALADNMPLLVQWLINSYCECMPKMDPCCMAAHGDIAHACGPTTFLTQLDIITKQRPFSNSIMLASGTAEAYYLTRNPTRCLEKLRAALEHVDLNIDSPEKCLQCQMTLNNVLVDSLERVSHNYTAPQISKKMVDWWSQGSGLSWEHHRVADLRKSQVADQKDGLSKLDEQMPLAVVEEVFGAKPPLWPMWHCLIQRVKASPEFLSARMDDLTTLADKFYTEKRFPPNLCQLVGLLDESNRKSKRKAGHQVPAAKQRRM